MIFRLNVYVALHGSVIASSGNVGRQKTGEISCQKKQKRILFVKFFSVFLQCGVKSDIIIEQVQKRGY